MVAREETKDEVAAFSERCPRDCQPGGQHLTAAAPEKPGGARGGPSPAAPGLLSQFLSRPADLLTSPGAKSLRSSSRTKSQNSLHLRRVSRSGSTRIHSEGWISSHDGSLTARRSRETAAGYQQRARPPGAVHRRRREGGT